MATDPPAQGFGASLDVAIDLPLATAPSRGLARIVDILVVSVVQLVVGSVIGVAGAVALGLGDADPTTIGIAVGVWLLVLFVLQWCFLTGLELWMGGQTPGKRLLGLRVVRDDGGTLTLVPALIRNLLRLDSIPGGGVIDLALLLWTPEGKRLGDLAAGTVVIEEPKAGPARTWPAWLPASDVALLEVWFARAPNLDPDRREPIAEKLVARLAAAHPERVARAETALLTLERLAPLADAG